MLKFIMILNRACKNPQDAVLVSIPIDSMQQLSPCSGYAL